MRLIFYNYERCFLENDLIIISEFLDFILKQDKKHVNIVQLSVIIYESNKIIYVHQSSLINVVYMDRNKGYKYICLKLRSVLGKILTWVFL
jgi:hypothetical protein